VNIFSFQFHYFALIHIPSSISQQGSFFRTLRNLGVQVDHSLFPQKPAAPPLPPPNGDAVAARIDDADEETPADVKWQVIANYQDTEEGDSEWTLKARDQEGLDKAIKLIQEATEHAKSMSHAGFLTLPDRSVFPRIVGKQGVNVKNLRMETGADIIVGRDNNVIVITGVLDSTYPKNAGLTPVLGSESTILSAKGAIMRIVASKGRGGRLDD
jgi:hypothetical protein